MTFDEIHKLITDENYYKQKISTIKNIFLSNKYSQNDSYDLLKAINYLRFNYFSLDSRTFNILKSEISRITNCFISNYDILKTFCPKKENVNFFRI